ncbi:glycoside hydrolase family 5 protein [Phormidium sp. CCY1219]|uniref:glycoside hydrolase family 5 protein n=1 Tax=Phormidium sp. CCY1219 TaxID=2886104 RepID=UPI002D1F232F|nr:cellulase family glycosylhydrolase [Phormidium sp. CCY1219]MEB3829168.1 glycoside hydrolase family 5 protein [Phormidium sp. CCY1219]
MKFIKTVWGLTLVGFMLPGIAPAQAGSPNDGRALQPSQDRLKLVDKRKNALTRGINLSHWFAQHDHYHPTHMENFITDEDFDRIEELGFQHVRLPVDPELLLDESNPETLDGPYLEYLDGALDELHDRNISAIVDLQAQDSMKDRLVNDDAFVDTYTQFAGALAEHLSPRDPNKLFLEGLNEPSFNFFAPEDVDPVKRWDWVQKQMLEEMRAGAPNHTLIATTYDWSGIDSLETLTPVEDPNVVYNFHFYEPMSVTHQGADWIDDEFAEIANLPYPFNRAECDAVIDSLSEGNALERAQRYCDGEWDAQIIDARIAKAADWATKHDVRLTANEFGVYRNFIDPEDRARWIGDTRSALEKYDIGWAMWDYTGGFGVMDKTEDGERIVNQAIVEALGLPGLDEEMETEAPAPTEKATENPEPEQPATTDKTTEDRKNQDPVEELEFNPVVAKVENNDTEEKTESGETSEGERTTPQEPTINANVIPPGFSKAEERETPRKVPEPSAIASLAFFAVGTGALKRQHDRRC